MSIARELEQRCTVIADHLRARAFATEGEIKACYDQPVDGDLRWALTYGDLRSIHAEGERARASGGKNSDDQVLAALSDEPETLSIGHGKPVSVYPKSFEALQTLARIGARIDYLLAKTRDLLTGGLALSDGLLADVDREVLFLYRCLVLGVTHEGPTLPFSDLSDIKRFPTWIIVLSPTDIRLIHVAFIRVNAKRLAVLTKLIKAEAGEDGPGSSWATFFSIRSDESHLPSPTLMRDHSLPSQMAAALLATSAKLRAQETEK